MPASGEIGLLFEGGLLLTHARTTHARSHYLLHRRVVAPEWLVSDIHEPAREVVALAEDPES